MREKKIKENMENCKMTYMYVGMYVSISQTRQCNRLKTFANGNSYLSSTTTSM